MFAAATSAHFTSHSEGREISCPLSRQEQHFVGQ
jgi:hypothetical protein